MKFTLIGGVKDRVIELSNKIINYLTRERLIAASMLSKVITIIMVLSVLPIGTVKVNADSDVNKQEKSTMEPKVYLDVHSAVLVKVKDQNVPKITAGESNDQRKQREEAEQKAAQEADRTVLAREVSRVIAPADLDLNAKRELAKKAASAYGIDWKLLEAVWQVESGKAWDTGVASYAGAQGPMQFMPGTWAGYAVDADGDGSANINDAEDAVYTGAKYLAAGGAGSGNVDQALFNYNHAQWYVDKVKGVADSIVE